MNDYFITNKETRFANFRAKMYHYYVLVIIIISQPSHAYTLVNVHHVNGQPFCDALLGHC
jgi:hypothetical protein